MKKIIFILLIGSLFSCNKKDNINPYSPENDCKKGITSASNLILGTWTLNINGYSSGNINSNNSIQFLSNGNTVIYQGNAAVENGTYYVDYCGSEAIVSSSSIGGLNSAIFYTRNIESGMISGTVNISGTLYTFSFSK